MTDYIQQYAYSILKAAKPWPDAIKTRHYKKWRPNATPFETPWAARLDAYQFGGIDRHATIKAFRNFNESLVSLDANQRVQTVRKILEWGRVRPRTPWGEYEVNAVINAARSDSPLQNLVPWSSSWTKIAAAATIDADFKPSPIVPQVIWDSRVSFAIAELSQDSVPGNKLGLLIVQGRTEGREPSSVRTQKLKEQGWKFAQGSWKQRSAAFWKSQKGGSLLIREMTFLLNNHPDFEAEREHHAKWTSFDTALALFVEGY